ncbi:MAG TPA: hypothetical protein PKI03_03360 [Pseudomonadota bacterium]|nr:hypothetical protein [Pseudomonadota bacterium]
MNLRQIPSRRLGRNNYISTILFLYLFLCAICRDSRANDQQNAEQEICFSVDPMSFAPEQISDQIRHAQRLYAVRNFHESAREFQILFQQYPSCWFLFPVILSYVNKKDCATVSELYRLVPTRIENHQDNEFSHALRQIDKIVAETCPHRASAGNPSAALATDSAASIKDQMMVQVPMSIPAPSVLNDSLSVPLVSSARSRALPERRPWYRKAWPWLTAAGVAVTATGIGIGIGLGSRPGQGTGVPYSSIYDGPEAVPLARSVH